MKKLDFEVMSSVEGGKDCEAIKVASLCMTVASVALSFAIPGVASVLIFGPSEIAFAVAGLSC